MHQGSRQGFKGAWGCSGVGTAGVRGHEQLFNRPTVWLLHFYYIEWYSISKYISTKSKSTNDSKISFYMTMILYMVLKKVSKNVIRSYHESLSQDMNDILKFIFSVIHCNYREIVAISYFSCWISINIMDKCFDLYGNVIV